MIWRYRLTAFLENRKFNAHLELKDNQKLPAIYKSISDS
jgi:hypothetical protein